MDFRILKKQGVKLTPLRLAQTSLLAFLGYENPCAISIYNLSLILGFVKWRHPIDRKAHAKLLPLFPSEPHGIYNILSLRPMGCHNLF